MQLKEEDIIKLWNDFVKHKSHLLKHKLILNYIWLVNYVIQRMNLPSKSILTDEDFVSFGILGLHEAIERFEPDRGVKFESYAIPRIKGKVQDELRKLDWLSRTARKKAHDYNNAIDELRSELGREVNPEEIMQKLNINEEKYLSYLEAAAAAKASITLSENQVIQTDEEDYDVMQEIPEEVEFNILEKIENEERLDFIINYIKDLPEKKRMVITLYYYENLTFKEIGKLLEVSESRICQIHTQLISELKIKLTEFENA